MVFSFNNIYKDNTKTKKSKGNVLIVFVFLPKTKKQQK